MGIIECVALYGAVIGTIGACWHLRNWWYDRPHIDVKVAYALTESKFTGTQHLIALSTVNRGKQTIQLTGAGFEVEERRNVWFMASPLVMPEQGLPHELRPNTEHTVYFSLPDLVTTLVEENKGQAPRCAWFRDATGKVYKKGVDQRAFHSWVQGARKISK